MKKYLYMSVVVLVAAAAASAVVAVADTVPSASKLNHTPAASRASVKSRTQNINATCMQTAIEKREVALIAAVDTFHSKASQALTTRKDALKIAWGISETASRRTALKTVWDEYKKSTRNARNTLKEARRSAWSGFKIDSKECGGSASAEDGGSESADINL